MSSRTPPLTRARFNAAHTPLHASIRDKLNTIGTTTQETLTITKQTQRDVMELKATMEGMVSGELRPAGEYQNRGDEKRQLRLQRQHINNRLLKMSEQDTERRLAGGQSTSAEMRERLQAQLEVERKEIAEAKKAEKVAKQQAEFDAKVATELDKKLTEFKEKVEEIVDNNPDRKADMDQAVADLAAMGTDALKCQYVPKRGRNRQVCDRVLCSKHDKHTAFDLKMDELGSESD